MRSEIYARIHTGLVQADRRLPTIAALAVGSLLWGLSLINVPIREMNDIGLLSVLPATYYLALIVVTISFCLNVFAKENEQWVLQAHLGLLILIFHGTPQILYGTLRYTWAWKHVGVVDYILRHHQVNPNIDFLQAYHNWPGFFALNALFVETAGLHTAASYAGWAPVFFNLLFAAALFFVTRALTSDRRVVWLTAWFFVAANWVGQDYLAPQAFGFYLYLVLLGILLHWFRLPAPPEKKTLRRWLRIEPLVNFFDRLFQRSWSIREDSQPSPIQRTVLVAIAILLMFVVVFTHQLTPLLIISSLIFLVLFQIIATRGLPVLMIILESTWVWFFASAFVAQNLKWMLKSFGTLDNNFAQNFINLGTASPGQVLVAWVGRGLTVLVFLLAGLGFLRRVRHGHVDFPATLLVISAFSLLPVNSYGGEILFRIYFFALPFLAFFIGNLLLPNPNYQPSWRTTAVTVSLSSLLIAGFLFAYYGKERQYYFTPQEIAAAQYLFNTAPPGALIIEESGNYPSLFHNYEYYTHVPISMEPSNVRNKFLQNPVKVLEQWMSDTNRYKAAYFIVTRSQKAEIDMLGEMPAGSGTIIEQKIAQSGHFTILYQNQDAAIYVLKDLSQP